MSTADYTIAKSC